MASLNINDLIKEARTIRRFKNDRVSRDEIVEIVNGCRFLSSGSNIQPKKYIVVSDEKICEEIFPTLKWAALLTDWDGPVEGERPTGYIVVLHDKSLSGPSAVDSGIVACGIALNARSRDLGSCIIASVDREKLYDILSIKKEEFAIDFVVALGYPNEEVVIDEMKEGDYKYYRDSNDVHHVPKRSLMEVLIKVY